eukprot:79942-Amphidinium_carterae.1
MNAASYCTCLPVTLAEKVDHSHVLKQLLYLLVGTNVTKSCARVFVLWSHVSQGGQVACLVPLDSRVIVHSIRARYAQHMVVFV